MLYPTINASSTTVAGWSLEGPYEGNESVRNMPIHSTPFQVGRRRDLSLTLPRPEVSGLHAELALSGSDLILRDMGSTNGTFVNGQRVQDPVVLGENDLIQFATVPFRVRQQCNDLIMRTIQGNAMEGAVSIVNFDRLMSDRAVTPYFQPIIRLGDGKIVGHEMLGRTRLPLLENPREMFQVAKQLNLEVELSVLLREEGVRVSQEMACCPNLFVNTHAMELVKPGLIESLRSTRDRHPTQPLVLEIHESAVSSSRMMADIRLALNDLNIGLAYDDFGSGQNRLNELVEVPPDYLKFDMSLIRGIHKASPARVRMLETLVRMVLDLGIVPLAEGVECEEESQACIALRFELGQGFHYGRPAPVAP